MLLSTCPGKTENNYSEEERRQYEKAMKEMAQKIGPNMQKLVDWMFEEQRRRGDFSMHVSTSMSWDDADALRCHFFGKDTVRLTSDLQEALRLHKNLLELDQVAEEMYCMMQAPSALPRVFLKDGHKLQNAFFILQWWRKNWRYSWACPRRFRLQH